MVTKDYAWVVFVVFAISGSILDEVSRVGNSIGRTANWLAAWLAGSPARSSDIVEVCGRCKGRGRRLGPRLVMQFLSPAQQGTPSVKRYSTRRSLTFFRCVCLWLPLDLIHWQVSLECRIAASSHRTEAGKESGWILDVKFVFFRWMRGKSCDLLQFVRLLSKNSSCEEEGVDWQPHYSQAWGKP